MTMLQKNKKLAAGIGVAAVAAAALALGAGTYAAFTDTENIPSSTFAAGSMNLVVGGSFTSGPTTYSNLAPGSRVPLTLSIDNTGTIDGKLTLSFATSGTENGCVEPETDNETPCTDASELLSALRVSYNGSDVGPLSGLAGISPINLGPLAASPGPASYAFEIVVPSTANNSIMTDTATITATATLTQ